MWPATRQAKLRSTRSLVAATDTRQFHRSARSSRCPQTAAGAKASDGAHRCQGRVEVYSVGPTRMIHHLDSLQPAGSEWLPAVLWSETEEGSMYFQQFYLGCLSHASYLIGSEGVAAVIDPQRDVGIYIEDAVKNG